jgi:hypothetical protein
MSIRPSWFVAAGVTIAVIAVVGVLAVSATSPVDGRAVAAPALAMSDEEQVSDLVDRFESAWNAEDFAELRTLLCEEVRSQEMFSVAGLTELRADAGRWVGAHHQLGRRPRRRGDGRDRGERRGRPGHRLRP